MKQKLSLLPRVTCILLLTVLFIATLPAHAAESLSFSITPTMFEMAAAPGQAWKTSVKVVNENPYELTVYATPVNFAPKGELGHGSFIPIFESATDGATLAEWITVSAAPIIIPKESSVSVPVQLNVPLDAAPGGHYAAVMIGTRPPDTGDRLQVKTSQVITSLFFVTVAGDVNENGEVRTFRAESMVAQRPEMSFEVRFENRGNVHLQPQGEILITNMWGKERGRIPINRDTHFGNVLPESVRQFNFTWKGEYSVLDIGRYKALLTLAYGSSEKHFVSRTATFWIIPVKPLLITLFTFAFMVWFVARSVRTYVRYMLRLSGIDPDTTGSTASGTRYVPRSGDVKIERKRVSIQRPITNGYAELRARLSHVKALGARLAVVRDFFYLYRVFFVSVLIAVLLVGVVWYYLVSVTSSARDYEVTIENPGNPVTISSEQIIHDSVTEPTVASETLDQAFTLSLVNSSDTPGQAAALADILAVDGYRIDDLQSDFGPAKPRSVVVYSTELEDVALTLSQKLGGALLSAYAASSTDARTPTITVFIGNDFLPSNE